MRLLAERLYQSDGQDVRIDSIKPALISWPQWINTQLVECDKWVVVCDAEYKQRVDVPGAQFSGGGVTLEYFSMLDSLYNQQGRNSKIVPVYFAGAVRVTVVPQALLRYSCFELAIPVDAEDVTRGEWGGYERFYSQGLYDQPNASLGEPPSRGPRVPRHPQPLVRWNH